MEQELTLKQLKTNRIVYLDKEMTVQDAAYAMKREGVSSVVILDGKIICGIVTEGNIMREVICGELNPRQTKLSQVMSFPVHRIESDKTVIDAARLMREKKVKKLVVVEGRDVTGIISEHDIVEILPAILAQKK
jgi:signal-transduction protein with cAMP-binding, CBS, and nucleotidyltransferase domain